MAQPFEGIRVLDLTHVLAGPFCTYQLAVLGADVIKIEPPHEPDCARFRGPDAARNAARRGLTYRGPGRQQARAVARPQVRPRSRRVAAPRRRAPTCSSRTTAPARSPRSGSTTPRSSARIRALVRCSITGFGQDGPRATVNAYDNVVQAASGVMARTGTAASGPVKTGASFVDYATGWNAAFAIAAALFARARDGRGQRIDCAMYDTALAMMGPELAATLHGDAPRRDEAGLGCYATADGLLMLGAFTPEQNRRLWTALGRPDFAALDSWEALWAHAGAMRTALEERMRERTAEGWMTFCRELGVPAERVRGLDEAARDPQLATRALLGRADSASPTVPVAAFRFAHDGPRLARPAPGVGEHSDEILREIGLSDREIVAVAHRGRGRLKAASGARMPLHRHSR